MCSNCECTKRIGQDLKQRADDKTVTGRLRLQHSTIDRVLVSINYFIAETPMPNGIESWPVSIACAPQHQSPGRTADVTLSYSHIACSTAQLACTMHNNSYILSRSSVRKLKARNRSAKPTAWLGEATSN